MTAIPASQWLARTLAGAGTTHAFFVDAIMRNTLMALPDFNAHAVLAHTEKAAAYMADGYARIARRPGICMAQSVGAANLAAGLQDAFLGHSPVIAITGRKVEAHQHRNPYQEIDHHPLFTPVTKFSARIDAASELPRLFAKAWRLALSGTPRPVHLDVAGLQGEVIEAGTVDDSSDAEVFSAIAPLHRFAPAPGDVHRACIAIRRSQRPLIVLGAGAALSDARDAALRLGELLSAPIATTLGGRGLVPTRHALSIGTIGTYGIPPTNEIVHGADVVIVVGSQLSDQSTTGWRVPAASTTVVQIDVDPAEIGHSYLRTLGVVGDPKITLEMLADELQSEPQARSGAFAQAAAGKITSWREAMAAMARSNESPVRIERLCRAVQESLPEDGILVADTGYSGIWTCTLVELNGTNQTYLRAAGSLGWAFPAALGAKCAAPHRKVVCFTGDGGFYYHVAELETARRRDIPIVVVVNNNSGFGQDYNNMARQGKNAERMRDLACFGPTDFARVAQSFGVTGIRVENPDELTPALERALASDGTVVIDVATELTQTPPQAWTPPA